MCLPFAHPVSVNSEHTAHIYRGRCTSRRTSRAHTSFSTCLHWYVRFLVDPLQCGRTARASSHFVRALERLPLHCLPTLSSRARMNTVNKNCGYRKLDKRNAVRSRPRSQDERPSHIVESARPCSALLSESLAEDLMRQSKSEFHGPF